MIEDLGGRLRSVRTQAEVEEILRKEISNLKEDEREVVMLALRELLDPAMRGVGEAREGGGPTRILDAMSDSEYIRTPVDVRTFVNDPYYLGSTSDVLYPKLQEDLAELFQGGYKEAILTGSIGWGKTFFASIAVCRCLYEISCMRDPHRAFGLAPDSNISFVALSISEALAIKVVFENIAVKLKQSPYFEAHFPFEETKKELRFPKKVWVAARSSTDTSALGLNVFGAILDEGNFMSQLRPGSMGQGAKWGTQDKAQVLYDQLVRRMKSRFQRHGRIPGLMLIVSSKRSRDDFTARRIRDAKDDLDVFVRDYATWDVRPEIYSPQKFPVLVGNETVPSRIITDQEAINLRHRTRVQDGLVIIQVPEDFRKDFEADIDGAIRDIGGVETVSVSPYFQQRDKIAACIDKNRKHPFEVMEWDQTKQGGVIWERIAKKAKIRDGAEVFDAWQPIYYPGVARHIHIDPSLKSDATGFCIGCVAGYKNVERRDPDTGETYTEPAPMVWIDLVLRVVPPVGGEIDHGLLRSLVYQFQNHGFPIGLVTMDQYNSAPSIQKFSVKGIDAERLSVDRPMDAYETLKSALYEGRVLMYEYEPLLHEIRTLQHDKIKNKVDHQRGGSKDCSDSLAGVVFSLITKYRGQPMGIMRGISSYGSNEMDEQRKIVEPTTSGTDDFLMPFIIG